MQLISKSKIRPKLKTGPKLSRHYLGTLVTHDSTTLLDGKSCLESVRKIIKDQNVVCLGEQLYTLPNHSFTLLVALAESHISIHTWPERSTVQLDVFLCNYLRDNTKKCEAIYSNIVDYFGATKNDTTVIKRS